MRLTPDFIHEVVIGSSLPDSVTLSGICTRSFDDWSLDVTLISVTLVGSYRRPGVVEMRSEPY